jgi:hypothetical protein
MNSERTSTNTNVKQRRDYKTKTNEIKKTTKDMEELLNKDIENLRKRIKQKSWK